MGLAKVGLLFDCSDTVPPAALLITCVECWRWAGSEGAPTMVSASFEIGGLKVALGIGLTEMILPVGNPAMDFSEASEVDRTMTRGFHSAGASLTGATN